MTGILFSESYTCIPTSADHYLGNFISHDFFKGHFINHDFFSFQIFHHDRVVRFCCYFDVKFVAVKLPMVSTRIRMRMELNSIPLLLCILPKTIECSWCTFIDWF